MFPPLSIDKAYQRIAKNILETPVTFDKELHAFLKWENTQKTGSFKLRGASNKILTLTKEEKKIGIITASAGNHGQGVALAAKQFHIPVDVYVPETAPLTKINAIKHFGANLITVPGGYEETEQAARQQAARTKACWISPYNDMQVIEGQGTVALETCNQLSLNDKHREKYTWLVPVSGGGLIAGIASYVKTHFPEHIVIGIQSETNPFMFNLLHTGSQGEPPHQETIADGLDGRVEENSVTIPLVKEYVDDIILVTEKEIRSAISYAWFKHTQKIEGAGAVTLAALLFGHITDRPAIAVISGGNIDDIVHKQLLEEHANGNP